MPRPRHETDAALQALYDQIPPIPGCKGLCWTSCGPIDMTDRERQRIRQAGVKISRPADAVRSAAEYWCEALGPDGRCTVYPIRPMICRLWGAFEVLACPYGCRPEGGWMAPNEVTRLLQAADEVAGASGEVVVPVPASGNPLQSSACFKKPMLAGPAGDLRRAVVHDELPETVRRRPRRTVRLPAPLPAGHAPPHVPERREGQPAGGGT